MSVTGIHELQDTSMVVKTGQLLLSGSVDCGTGTCDNIAVISNTYSDMSSNHSNQGIELTQTFGYIR